MNDIIERITEILCGITLAIMFIYQIATAAGNFVGSNAGTAGILPATEQRSVLVAEVHQ